MSPAAIEALALLPGRCQHGYHVTQRTLCGDCTPATDEWATFTAALKAAVRADGTVHASDMRRLVGGRIEPRHIGTLYRRARSRGLLVEAGHERSDDVAGKNAGRLEPFYSIGSAA